MQDKKKQLEPDIEKKNVSNLGKEYAKAVYWYPAYLTSQAKLLSEEALQIAEKTREAKVKGEKRKNIPI